MTDLMTGANKSMTQSMCSESENSSKSESVIAVAPGWMLTIGAYKSMTHGKWKWNASKNCTWVDADDWCLHNLWTCHLTPRAIPLHVIIKIKIKIKIVITIITVTITTIFNASRLLQNDGTDICIYAFQRRFWGVKSPVFLTFISGQTTTFSHLTVSL